jgi:hypothetical protein
MKDNAPSSNYLAFDLEIAKVLLCRPGCAHDLSRGQGRAAEA